MCIRDSSLPAIALGLEPADDDVMSRPPRNKEDSIFSNGLLSKIIFRGLLLGLTTLAVFVTFINLYGDLATARTGALVTLVLTQLIHVFECKSEERSIFGVHYFNNWKLIGAVAVSTGVLLVCLYHPILRLVMRTVALSGMQQRLVFGYSMAAVSYTHRDVYKRQPWRRPPAPFLPAEQCAGAADPPSFGCFGSAPAAEGFGPPVP